MVQVGRIVKTAGVERKTAIIAKLRYDEASL